ncbi:MAG: hypothetical protein IPM29_15240 [Planctomycetes bacterium]|nr:hypothetical protein [Planctomycetota bacterium]
MSLLVPRPDPHPPSGSRDRLGRCDPGQHDWAIVLAAGDGTRLRAITVDEQGRAVPKQYCSLCDGPSLLEEAIFRARAVARPDRVLTIVAAEHCAFWQHSVDEATRANLVVQPANRGTAAGLLLPVLEILDRDPHARISIFPSDHHVQDESVLLDAIDVALRTIHVQPNAIAMLGMTPDAPESEYGWIVPAGSSRSVARIREFVEKPPVATATRLMGRGGLWNTFMMVATARGLVDVVAEQLPALVSAMSKCFEVQGAERRHRLERLYADLPTHDFSRDVLEGATPHLRVVRVPNCGWTDLGTPRRVAECLARKIVPDGLRQAGRPAPVVLRHSLARLAQV